MLPRSPFRPKNEMASGETMTSSQCSKHQWNQELRRINPPSDHPIDVDQWKGNTAKVSHNEPREEEQCYSGIPMVDQEQPYDRLDQGNCQIKRNTSFSTQWSDNCRIALPPPIPKCCQKRQVWISNLTLHPAKECGNLEKSAQRGPSTHLKAHAVYRHCPNS